MLHKRKKGSALVTVVMIMLVLTILGLSLLGVSLAEAKHAEWEDKRIQSHYIGRSGVYVGLKILNDLLIEEDVTDINTLVTKLNITISALDAGTFKVGDKGSFTLKYEVFESGNVKIRSVGTTAGSSSVSETVTYTVKIIPSMSMQTNPDVWVSGINLKHSINPSNPALRFLGKGVLLSSKPIQSPQGGGEANASIFQASVIYFRNNNGLCFKQITNCAPITFDSEIIYFESGVELNKTSNPVVLAISESTIKYRMENDGVIPIYCPPEPPLTDPVTPIPILGFEDYGRYKAFIGSNTDDLHSTYKSKFGSANYGVVYFGGDVVVKEKQKDTPIMKVNKGYYYFRNGVNLHSLTPTTLGDNLIPIPNNDAIINAIKSLFKSRARVEDAIWDKK